MINFLLKEKKKRSFPQLEKVSKKNDVLMIPPISIPYP